MRNGDNAKLRIGNISIIIAKTTRITQFYDWYLMDFHLNHVQRRQRIIKNSHFYRKDNV